MKDRTNLISCICVTQRLNTPLLERAISCFRHQDYQDKELIILSQENATGQNEETEFIEDGDITYIKVRTAEKLTLGKIRNMAIKFSKGAYFCMWDDDDWHHPTRLKIQYQAIKDNRKTASVLTNLVLYNAKKGEAYISAPGPWAGTIMCKKDVFNDYINYPELNKSEDLHFIHKLFKTGSLFPVTKPTLYVYVYHTANTWNARHFDKLFGKGQKISAAASKIIAETIDHELYDIERDKMNSPVILHEINYFHHFLKTLKIKY